MIWPIFAFVAGLLVLPCGRFVADLWRYNRISRIPDTKERREMRIRSEW
jgi:hypothetical protein